MRKNIKDVFVYAVIPLCSVLFWLVVGEKGVAVVVACLFFVLFGILSVIRSRMLDDLSTVVERKSAAIERLDFDLRSLRAKYGRLKSDIREMVK